MRYTPDVYNLLIAITYGSRLYGTNTPTSDYDFKAVSLPTYKDLLLSKELKVERYRFDVYGNKVPDSCTMPDNGYEAEHTPVQKFVHDYLGGQAYAIEIVYAALGGGFHEEHVTDKNRDNVPKFIHLCYILASSFKHKNLHGMVGFAVKQTFDYVRRGERLLAAQDVMAAINALEFKYPVKHNAPALRLDTVIGIRVAEQFQLLKDNTVLAELLSMLEKNTTVKLGEASNNGKTYKTIEINGRSYSEMTAVSHFKVAVQKLIDSYGTRSTLASETAVDWKSLSHAVRVYEQVLELLNTGNIVFPRKNALELLSIRLGEVPLEEVKLKLKLLDDEVNRATKASTLPEVDQAMRDRMDKVLFNWLTQCYD